MAFVKNQTFAFEKIELPKENINVGVVSIPLVITKENGKYHGFVPGFVMKDFIDENKEKCLENLTIYIKNTAKDFVKNKKQFPDFPTNEDIKNDFKYVVTIKRFSVKTNN